MKPRIRLSLATKFDLLVVLLVVTCAGGVAAFGLRAFAERDREVLVERAREVAQVATRGRELALHARDVEGLRRIATAVAAAEGVAYARLLGTDAARSGHWRWMTERWTWSCPCTAPPRAICCAPWRRVASCRP
jgi:hypothetical protein